MCPNVMAETECRAKNHDRDASALRMSGYNYENCMNVGSNPVWRGKGFFEDEALCDKCTKLWLGDIKKSKPISTRLNWKKCAALR